MSQDSREVLRCRACQLNQYMTRSGNCRKCRKQLMPPPPVVISAPASTTIQPTVYSERRDLGAGVARAIRVLRQARGLSQRQLAMLLKTPRTYISKLETNKATPTMSSIEKLTTALDVAPSGFVWLAGELA